MKSQACREFAQKLYVEEGRTYRDIGQLLDITEKTVWEWGKPSAGNWEEKRNNFVTMQTTCYEKQYGLLITVTNALTKMLAAETIPDQRLISLYDRLSSGINRTKEFEDGMRAAREKNAESKKEGLSDETLEKIESEMKML